MKKLFRILISKLKNETYVFVIAIAVLIAIFATAVSCTHFSLKVGELKDAEVTLDNQAKE